MSYYTHNSLLATAPIQINNLEPIRVGRFYWYPPTGGSVGRSYYPDYMGAADRADCPTLLVSQGNEENFAPFAWYSLAFPTVLHITANDVPVELVVDFQPDGRYEGLNGFTSYIVLNPSPELIEELRGVSTEYLYWCLTGPEGLIESNWQPDGEEESAY